MINKINSTSFGASYKQNISDDYLEVKLTSELHDILTVSKTIKNASVVLGEETDTLTLEDKDGSSLFLTHKDQDGEEIDSYLIDDDEGKSISNEVLNAFLYLIQFDLYMKESIHFKKSLDDNTSDEQIVKEIQSLNVQA